jgi:Tfp pilus assembly protein PilF
MRIANNYRVFRARELARKGDFGRAKVVVRKLISHDPNSIGYNLLLADIELFSEDFANASRQYQAAKELMRLEPRLSKRNRRFLAAYANFRITAMKFHSAGQEWREWKTAARLIEELDADKRFKRVFKLPT